jgi:Leucine-rich repeat (LRR) protein
LFIILDLANNKLKQITGLKGLKNLKKIDLGANRIRVMDGEELGGLVSLEELWMGKNKIEKVEGLEKVNHSLAITNFPVVSWLTLFYCLLAHSLTTTI